MNGSSVVASLPLTSPLITPSTGEAEPRGSSCVLYDTYNTFCTIHIRNVLNATNELASVVCVLYNTYNTFCTIHIRNAEHGSGVPRMGLGPAPPFNPPGRIGKPTSALFRTGPYRGLDRSGMLPGTLPASLRAPAVIN